MHYTIETTIGNKNNSYRSNSEPKIFTFGSSDNVVAIQVSGDKYNILLPLGAIVIITKHE